MEIFVSDVDQTCCILGAFVRILLPVGGFRVLGLALERYLDSNPQNPVGYSLASSRRTGRPSRSSSLASGFFTEEDGQAQAPENAQMNSSFGNSSSFVSRTGHSSLGSGSGDMNRALGSAANSGASGSASSLVTDANSALSAGPHLQRSASVNTESYLRLPASPMSFSSNNNISISGSSVMDGSSIVQQSSHQDQQRRQQQQQQGASSASSYPTSRMGQVSVTGPQLHASSSQDPNSLLHMQNKPRLDFRQDGILQQQAIQQMLQRQDPMQLQRHNPQIQAFIQQQKLWQQRNQQQMLQSMPQLQRAQLEQQHMRQQLPQQGVQLASGVKRPYDSGICARRLMQYMYHQRQRPTVSLMFLCAIRQ